MADFAYVPHRVEPGTPQYNVLTTEMEGFKKKRRIVTTDPKRTWTLYFRGQSKTERDLLLAHYKGQYGQGTPFNWTSVPSYISDDSSYYVAYESYSEVCIMNNIWEITIVFEEQFA
ncbi:MAG: hypothetical protein RBR32_01645 [Bacteroidales bacterium]|nr:hypothetical protein [Bacteroidales bacterium]